MEEAAARIFRRPIRNVTRRTSSPGPRRREANSGSRGQSPNVEVDLTRRDSSEISPNVRPKMLAAPRAKLTPESARGMRRRVSSPGPARTQTRSNSSRRGPDPIPEAPPPPPLVRVTSENIAECFRSYDRNKDGKISREELRAVLKLIDQNGMFKDTDVDMLMDAMDPSHDGFIDYCQFAAWIKGDSCEPESEQIKKQFEVAVSQCETPAQKLARCEEELRQGEEDAKPPIPVKVVLEEPDLWIFTKKGETVASRRSIPGSATVCQISPKMDAYMAGVRIGDIVVGIGQQSVARDSLTLDKFFKEMGGGGGAARNVVVKFLSPQQIKAHEEALDRLVDLQEAVEKAREEVMRRAAEAALESHTVTVKYYHNVSSFHLVDGCLASDDIDQLFQISHVMPQSTLQLAETCPADVHIMAAEQMFIDVPKLIEKEQRALLGDEGVREYFKDLEIGKTYFLIVNPGALQDKKDREWRIRMRKEQEEERLAELPPHDCEKEQVPYGLRVETSQAEFDIRIDNTEGRLLGMNTVIDYIGSYPHLRVQEVFMVGLVEIWNRLHPVRQVMFGDYIVEVNGVRDDPQQLQSELKKKELLHISLRRVSIEPSDLVKGLYRNGAWYDAKVIQDNLDGTFTLRWLDGFEDDTVKDLFELHKDDEMQDDCHTKVGGVYWFVGSHNGRVMYRNSKGMLVNFHKAWRINRSEDSEHCIYSAPGETGLRPPKGCWLSPINPCRMANIENYSGQVCRICTLPRPLEDD